MSVMFSLIGSALLFMAIVFSLFQVKRWGKYWPVAYVLVAILLVLPVQHWLVVEFVWGYFSNLSMATLLAITVYLFGVIRPDGKQLQSSFKWFILILAVFMLPMSLGLTQFDPFSTGYASNEFYPYVVLGLTAVAFMAWAFNASHIVLMITLALLCNGFQVYESSNLWSYVIDPIIVIMCVFSFIFDAFRYLAGRIFKVVKKYV